jgi:hypothetical protein
VHAAAKYDHRDNNGKRPLHTLSHVYDADEGEGEGTRAYALILLNANGTGGASSPSPKGRKGFVVASWHPVEISLAAVDFRWWSPGMQFLFFIRNEEIMTMLMDYHSILQ